MDSPATSYSTASDQGDPTRPEYVSQRDWNHRHQLFDPARSIKLQNIVVVKDNGSTLSDVSLRFAATTCQTSTTTTTGFTVLTLVLFLSTSVLSRFPTNGKFYSTLTKASCLYGSIPRSTKASTTNVDKALSQILRLLDHSRTVGGSRQGIRNEEMVYPPR
uniref:Uncharacterized protein n=1 Tax=Oryza glaberrima TaxID=4538 RepID=I1QZB3_ORYGL